MPLPSQPLPLPTRMVPDPMSLGIISPNLGASRSITKLDTAAFVGADEAKASIGQGISKVGSALDQIALKKNEADAITAQYKAAELMEQTKADISQEVAGEQDQSKWSGIADARLGQLSTALTNLPNVPPDVKAGLDHRFNMFGIDVRDGLGQHAIRKSIGDAIGSANAVVQRAGMSGDLDLGTSTIDGMVAKHFMTPEEGELKKDQLSKQVQVTRQNQMKSTGEAAIQADPQAAYDHFTSKEFDAPPPVKQFLIQKAHAALMQDKEATGSALMSKVDGGQIVVPAQIDQEKEINPKITEEQAAHAKRALQSINNADRQQWNTENSSKTISGAMSAIRAYDPSFDPDRKQYDAINAYISSNLVTGDKEQARQALTSRASGKAIAEKDPVMQATVKTITDMQAKGELGGFSAIHVQNIPYTNEEGKTAYHHPSNVVIDRDAQAKSRDLAIQIEAHMRDYHAANPAATNEDMLNEIHRVTPDYVSARAATSAFGIPRTGRVIPDDRTGIQSDVPVRSDPADIIKGLPQYPGRTPKAEESPKAKDDPSKKEEALPEQSSTADPGDGLPEVGGGELFPKADGDKIVGGDSMMPALPKGAGQLPEERKKKRR